MLTAFESAMMSRKPAVFISWPCVGQRTSASATGCIRILWPEVCRGSPSRPSILSTRAKARPLLSNTLRVEIVRLVSEGNSTAPRAGLSMTTTDLSYNGALRRTDTLRPLIVPRTPVMSGMASVAAAGRRQPASPVRRTVAAATTHAKRAGDGVDLFDLSIFAISVPAVFLSVPAVFDARTSTTRVFITSVPPLFIRWRCGPRRRRRASPRLMRGRNCPPCGPRTFRGAGRRSVSGPRRSSVAMPHPAGTA